MYCVSLRVLKFYKSYLLLQVQIELENFLTLLIKKFRGFIILWENIIIDPLATMRGGEYLSKDSNLLHTLKL